MINTTLHKIDTSDTEWQVAHLFEHLLIRNFFSLLEERNIRSEMVGWVGGETFEDVLFIETGFYDKAVMDIFEEYINALPEFTEEQIAYSLATIAAEDRVEIQVQDMTMLRSELRKLACRPWDQQTTPPTIRSDETLLVEKRNSRNFRDIIIITKAEGLTPEEQKLFLRFCIFIMDLVNQSIAPIPGIYQRGHSRLDRREDAIAYMSQYTITKGTTLKDIRQCLDAIKTTDIQGAMPAIRQHFTVYAREPLWQTMPIDYFRETGIQTTNAEVASLATLERVSSLLSKVTFTVRSSLPADNEYIR